MAAGMTTRQMRIEIKANLKSIEQWSSLLCSVRAQIFESDRREAEQKWRELTSQAVIVQLYFDHQENVAKLLALDQSFKPVLNRVSLTLHFNAKCQTRKFMQLVLDRREHANGTTYGLGFPHSNDAETLYQQLCRLRNEMEPAFPPVRMPLSPEGHRLPPFPVSPMGGSGGMLATPASPRRPLYTARASLASSSSMMSAGSHGMGAGGDAGRFETRYDANVTHGQLPAYGMTRHHSLGGGASFHHAQSPFQQAYGQPRFNSTSFMSAAFHSPPQQHTMPRDYDNYDYDGLFDAAPAARSSSSGVMRSSPSTHSLTQMNMSMLAGAGDYRQDWSLGDNAPVYSDSSSSISPQRDGEQASNGDAAAAGDHHHHVMADFAIGAMNMLSEQAVLGSSTPLPMDHREFLFDPLALNLPPNRHMQHRLHAMSEEDGDACVNEDQEQSFRATASPTPTVVDEAMRDLMQSMGVLSAADQATPTATPPSETNPAGVIGSPVKGRGGSPQSQADSH